MNSNDTTAKMESLIQNAKRIVEEFADEPEMHVFFKHCHGIVLLSAVEAAFLFSGNMGTGVLMRHDKKLEEWSPPCAIGLTGVGVGLIAGFEKKDIIMFLTEKSMVKTLTGEFQLRIGSEVTMAIGPDGNEEDVHLHFGNRGAATMSSFAHTKGLCIGISLEGGIVTPRTNVNESYYGEKVSPKKILFGQVKSPEDGALEAPLHKALDNTLKNIEEKKIPYKDTIASPFLKKPHVNKVE